MVLLSNSRTVTGGSELHVISSMFVYEVNAGFNNLLVVLEPPRGVSIALATT